MSIDNSHLVIAIILNVKVYKKEFVRRGRKSLFKPDFIASSVADIDFAFLKSLGITTLLIDLDGTVVERGKYEVNENVIKILKKQPFKIYIATNRPMKRNLMNLVEHLNAQGAVHPKGILGKPFPQYYKNVLAEKHLQKTEVAMVGDRILQDIWGANLAGLTTVAIRKQDEPIGLFDKILSASEAGYLQRIAKKYTTVRGSIKAEQT